EVADVIADRLLKPEDDAVKAQCFERVRQLCRRFPLYSSNREPALA
ncbi:MAG TPA: serine hydroxymethyltransferase, partial [Prochlorococcus sp.]